MRFDQRIFYMASPALNRELATSELVEAATLSISDNKVFSKMLLYGPFKTDLWADAVVTITFPDPILLELGKVGDRDRAEVLRLQQLKVLGALDAAVNYLKTGYRVPHVSDVFRHVVKISRTTGESENDGEVLVEVVRLTVNLIDNDSIGLLRDLAEMLLQADALQLARDIQIVVNVRGNIGKLRIDGELFDGKAARRPVSTWLTLEHKAEVLAFFSLPEVATMVAEGCRGKLVTCDKMNKGAAVTKRANVAEGTPITIEEPSDVPRLVDAMDFGAFYPNVERNDGLIGRLVCDLDMGRGFTGLLGPQRAWEACCKVSDAIVEAASGMGLPRPRGCSRGRGGSTSRGTWTRKRSSSARTARSTWPGTCWPCWRSSPRPIGWNRCGSTCTSRGSRRSCSWRRSCCMRCTRRWRAGYSTTRGGGRWARTGTRWRARSPGRIRNIPTR